MYLDLQRITLKHSMAHIPRHHIKVATKSSGTDIVPSHAHSNHDTHTLMHSYKQKTHSLRQSILHMQVLGKNVCVY